VGSDASRGNDENSCVTAVNNTTMIYSHTLMGS